MSTKLLKKAMGNPNVRRRRRMGETVGMVITTMRRANGRMRRMGKRKRRRRMGEMIGMMITTVGRANGRMR